jgi:hypothetical protein
VTVNAGFGCPYTLLTLVAVILSGAGDTDRLAVPLLAAYPLPDAGVNVAVTLLALVPTVSVADVLAVTDDAPAGESTLTVARTVDPELKLTVPAIEPDAGANPFPGDTVALSAALPPYWPLAGLTLTCVGSACPSTSGVLVSWLSVGDVPEVLSGPTVMHPVEELYDWGDAAAHAVPFHQYATVFPAPTLQCVIVALVRAFPADRCTSKYVPADGTAVLTGSLLYSATVTVPVPVTVALTSG